VGKPAEGALSAGNALADAGGASAGTAGCGASAGGGAAAVAPRQAWRRGAKHPAQGVEFGESPPSFLPPSSRP
jgi:hypothetical protein